MKLYTMVELDKLLANVTCRQDWLAIKWYVDNHNYPTCVKKSFEGLETLYKGLFDK